MCVVSVLKVGKNADLNSFRVQIRTFIGVVCALWVSVNMNCLLLHVVGFGNIAYVNLIIWFQHCVTDSQRTLTMMWELWHSVINITQHNVLWCCVVLITECHNSHKHSQNYSSISLLLRLLQDMTSSSKTTSIRPFRCSVCSRRSNWKCDIRKHYRQVHPGITDAKVELMTREELIEAGKFRIDFLLIVVKEWSCVCLSSLPTTPC